MSQSSSDLPFDRSGSVGLSESDVHRILASERRRALLSVLEDRRELRDLEGLASTVAEYEDGLGGPEPSFVDRVAATLHHNHLPKLAAVGLVEYDHRTGRVRTNDAFDRFVEGVDSIGPA